MRFLKLPKKCPRCGVKAGARILWGISAWSEQMQAALDRGTLVLGGCVVDEGQGFDYQCRACGNEWMSNADNIGRLVAMLETDGLSVTREQAEKMASRISGSVDEYIVFLKLKDVESANYKPLDISPEEVPDKFKDDLSYEIGPPPADD